MRRSTTAALGERGYNCEARASMPGEGNQRAHRHAEISDFGGAAEIRQIDDEASGDDICADLLQELHCPFRGAARGDEVIDEQHTLAAAAELLKRLAGD